jgi:hypothetical protein
VVDEKGQDVREADKGSLVELFKYATKLMTASGNGDKRFVSPEHLDVIFRAFRYRRTYQPYGFNVSADVEEVTLLDSSVPAFSRVAERVLWMWDQDMADWVDHLTGECMTGNTPFASRSASQEASEGPPDVLDAVQGWAPQRPRPKAALPLHAPPPAPLPEVGVGGDRRLPRP